MRLIPRRRDEDRKQRKQREVVERARGEARARRETEGRDAGARSEIVDERRLQGEPARGRGAEVDEEPIAEILGDVAAEAYDGARGGALVLRDDVAPLLGIELLRERRRADQVAEEDG
jgi:hypothetical protein